MTATLRPTKAPPFVRARAVATEHMPWALLLAMAHDLSVSLPMVANLVAVSSISWGITSMFAGAGSDRWGRRKFLIGGPFALAFAATGIATSTSFLAVATCVTIAGACCGMFTGVIFTEV